MSTETISLGLSPRTQPRAEVEPPHRSPVRRKPFATRAVTARALDRAGIVVEKAPEFTGAPVYVRKQIVHNRHVVGDPWRSRAIFVDEVDEVP